MKLTFPRFIVLSGIAVICMAFAATLSPPKVASEPGMYGVLSFDVDVYQAVKEFSDFAAVIVPAPADLDRSPSMVDVAEADVIAPVYRLAWQTDAHNLISPYLRC